MPDAKYLIRKWKNNYLDQFVRRRIKSVFEQLDLDTNNSPHKTDFNERLPALLEFMQTAWIKQQIDYQKQKQKTQENLHNKLEKLVNRVNLVVLSFGVSTTISSVFESIRSKSSLPSGIINIIFQMNAGTLICPSAIVALKPNLPTP